MGGPDLTDDALRPYVSAVAAEWDHDAAGGRWQVVDGALCMVDISGFTALSERLAQRGRVGAEELTDVLSGVFATMAALVHQRGGEQLKFGGDALLLLFTGASPAAEAAAAAVEMRAALQAVRGRPTSVGRLDLRMSTGVEAGPVHLFLVGGSHRELVVAGPTATAVTVQEARATPGEIRLGPLAASRLPAVAVHEVPGEEGGTLRWRRAPSPPPGPHLRRHVGADVALSCIPVGLRATLADGVHEAEHRMATVGFLRFAGVDDLLDREGPEAVADELDHLVREVQEAAEPEGVTFLASDVARDGGKVLLAAGVPTSHHDDDGRLLRTLRRVFDRPHRLPLSAGANRGHVFAGEVGGRRTGRAYTVMGDSVNVAARLMAAAPAGAIYAPAAVLEGSHTAFSARRLDPIPAKGKAVPLQAYEVGVETGPRRHDLRTETAFTGRTDELDRLDSALRRLAAGDGGVVTVEGPLGMGKSRLAHEALRRIEGSQVLHLRAEPFRSHTAYRPLRDALWGLLGLRRSTPEAMIDQLRRRVDDLDPGLLPLLPLVGDVVHLTVPATPEVDAIEPRFRPDRTAEVVERLLEVATPGPLVLLAEDAHGVDESTAHLLHRLAGATARQPWLLLALRQPGTAGFDPTDGERLVLEPLTEEDARTLVERATAAAPLRPHDVTTIAGRAGGNPLFLEEIVRASREAGGVDDLPDELGALVGAQIDLLPPADRLLVRCAAVLGGSFRPGVLTRVLAAEGLDLGALVIDLDGVETRFEGPLADVLVPVGVDRLGFRHDLLREAAYEGLSYRRRRLLHRRAAEVLTDEAGATPETVSDLLALHWWRAGEPAEAWHHAVLAGDRARAAFANPEAAANYALALEAAGRARVTPEARAEVLTHLGDVREQSGEFAAAFAAYHQASRLLRGDPVSEARLALRRARARERMGSYSLALRDTSAGLAALDGVDATEAPSLRAQLVTLRAVVRQAQQRPRPAIALAEQAAALAEQAGDRAALARSYLVLDWGHRQLGTPGHEGLAETALALFEAEGDLPGQAMVVANLGVLAYFDGRWDDAAELYERSRDAFLATGNAVQAAVSGSNIGELLVSQGRLDEAETVLHDASRVLRASSFADGATFADQQIGRLLAKRGESARAVVVLRSVHQELVALDLPLSALEAATHLADALLDDGEAGAALEVLDEAERRAGSDAGLLAAPVALVRGRILASLGRLPEAAELNALGMDSARQQDLPYELYLLLGEHSRLARLRGEDPDPAVVAEAATVQARLGLRPVRAVTSSSEGHPTRTGARSPG